MSALSFARGEGLSCAVASLLQEAVRERIFEENNWCETTLSRTKHRHQFQHIGDTVEPSGNLEFERSRLHSEIAKRALSVDP